MKKKKYISLIVPAEKDTETIICENKKPVKRLVTIHEDNVNTTNFVGKFMNSLKEHSILSDEKGNFYGVISHGHNNELVKKTLKTIESIIGDGVKNYTGKITNESAFTVAFNNEPSIEFWLTPTSII